MFTVNTFIKICAPRAAVWKVITDFNSFPNWNPLIKRATGELHPGSQLNIAIAQENGGELLLKPKVLVSLPDRELRWKGKVGANFILTGEHFFVLKDFQGGTELEHGEIFKGFASLLLSMKTRALHQQFDDMNTLVKSRAEGLVKKERHDKQDAPYVKRSEEMNPLVNSLSEDLGKTKKPLKLFDIVSQKGVFIGTNSSKNPDVDTAYTPSAPGL
ncbi:MAG: SRPBCC domain-containing protein [Legionella sp.]|nr:SRPBCC domain-containing protein [Legionella sp.]